MKQVKNKLNLVGYGALFVLLLLFLLMLYLTNSSPTSAAELSSTATSNLATHVDITLSLALADRVVVDVTPTSTGTFAPQTTQLVVSTNNLSGYSLYLHTATGNNDLISADTSNTAVISALPGASSATDMPANTWGYNLSTTDSSDSSYSAVPATPELVKSTAVNSNQDTYNLTFGVKIDNNLPAGLYHNSIIISAIANPVAATSLSELTYMQDMTSVICSNTMNYENVNNYIEKSLIDLRDGKSYYVAKLADGNCWMTQNLALDLSTSKTLTNADTDLNSVASWTPAASTGHSGQKSDTFAGSWNPGNYVITNPQRPNVRPHCAIPAASSPSECAQITNVANWYPNWISQTDTQDDYIGLFATNVATTAYDPHYLLGNYYTWETATAGGTTRTTTENINSLSVEFTDAVDSICPKGWRLPTSGRNTAADAGWPYDRTDSFYRLLRAYGYPETGSSSDSNSLNTTAWVRNSPGTAYTTIVGPGKTRLDGAPMYFARSGLFIGEDSQVYVPGYAGHYLSSTLRSDQRYYRFLFDENPVYPASEGNLSEDGYSMRCLAR